MASDDVIDRDQSARDAVPGAQKEHDEKMKAALRPWNENFETPDWVAALIRKR